MKARRLFALQRSKIDPAQIGRRGQRYPSRKKSISDAREDAMTNAGNALLWTALYFVLSFAAIFVVWFADKMRSNFLGKR
ncbi:hypothetical protein NLM27_19400 [Bradyrhizobium sp. CCGB12]|uniref:hypothetical protein n=1 Tax=Bradyrhizobium sp. CCGB12 TaxID=2949632 RepID=UPI0020B26BB9|nr:hypothetical protein [Bradyrhizobium sp. CCGB12]MCP3390950.1 hypothetical protein [Bradyrhizobium sp. CCGB12]